MENDRMAKQFNEVAHMYDDQRRFFIPCFDEYYGMSCKFIGTFIKNCRSILDLGAGTGLLSYYLYGIYKDADFTLVDLSSQMLDAARRRFSGVDNVQFLCSDYVTQFPKKTFDLIGSALSIHHLDLTEKVLLYTKIYAALENGGCFLVLDQFLADTPFLETQYQEWWMSYIKKSGISNEAFAAWEKRRELDKENSISETIALLKAVGFSQMECIYHYMKFGAIIAIK